MTPRLSMRGKLSVASAALYLSFGLLLQSSALVGFALLVFLGIFAAYFRFFRVAIELGRRRFDIAWWIGPGYKQSQNFPVNNKFDVTIEFRNRSSWSFDVDEAVVRCGSGLEFSGSRPTRVRSSARELLTMTCLPRAVGYQVFQGVELSFCESLGLFKFQAYFPSTLPFTITPSLSGQIARVSLPRNSAQRVQSRTHTRRRGDQGVFSQLRPYQPGDAFKSIAWKASGRKRSLIVRQVEEQSSQTCHLLLDTGWSMRWGLRGHARLDAGMTLCSQIARTVATHDGGIALSCFHDELEDTVPMGYGPRHAKLCIQRLAERAAVGHRGESGVAAAEMVARVADYLYRQESLDLRVRRRLKAADQAEENWDKIHPGLHGEFYEASAMHRVVGGLIRSMEEQNARAKFAPSWYWDEARTGEVSNSLYAKLRILCRLRGISLDSKSRHMRRKRLQVWHAIAQKIAGAPGVHFVVVTDLLSALVGLPRAFGDRKSRGSRRRLTILIPTLMAGSDLQPEVQVAERELFDVLRKELAPMGIRAFALGPASDLRALLNFSSRPRASVQRTPARARSTGGA